MDGKSSPATTALNASPTTEGSVKPTSSKGLPKSRYISPLSSLRNNYKPPTDNAAFRPISFSSPISAPVQKTQNEAHPDAARINVPHISLVQGLPEPIIGQSNPSLEGKGGEWRGPAHSDMRPANRNMPRFRADHFLPGPHSPQTARNDNGSPHHMNSSTPNRSNSFGQNNRFGNNSFGANNSRGNNSFGSNSFGNNSIGSQRGGYSPYNSTTGSHNYSGTSNRKDYNRGGHQNFGAKEDMSLYYHKSMLEDPWAQLVQLQARNS